jgi:hypothetical protein
MLGKAAELLVRIKTDTSQAKTDIDQTAGAFGKLGSSFATVFSPAAILAGGAAIGAGLVKVTMMASDLNETISASEVIFGDAAGAIKDFAADSARTLGMTKTEAIGAANTFATFGKSAGLAGTDLAGFSTDMVSLATDLASFKNTSPEQAIEALGAALRGESEPIKAYGVLLDEATLRQEALELGIVSTTKEALTPQQKVLAAQAAIMKRTTDAHNDFARTSGSVANQTKITSATLLEMATSIGTALLPIAEDLMAFINENILPGLKSFADTVSQNETAMTALAAVIGTVVLIAVIALTVALWNMAAAVIAATWPVLLIVAALAALAFGLKWLWDNVEPFRTAVEGAFQSLADTVKPLIDSIPERFQSFLDFLNNTFMPAVTNIWNAFRALMDPIVGFVQDHWNNIAEIFRNVLDMIKNIIANAWQIISNIWQFWLNVIKGDWGAAWDNIKNIMSAVWDTIQNIVSNAFGIMRETIMIMVDFMAGLARHLWDWLWEGLEGAINKVKDFFNGLIEFVKSIPRIIGDILSGLWDRMPKPPDWVPLVGGSAALPPPAGVGLMAVPTAGRAAVASPALMSTAPTINITVQHSGLGVDSPRLQRDLVEALDRYVRRNGPLAFTAP